MVINPAGESTIRRAGRLKRALRHCFTTLTACLALLLVACASGPQKLIVGRWQAQSAAKVTAEFSEDGTAQITMLGQTLRGNYRFTGPDELEWTVNGTTVRMKVKVTETNLEVIDSANRSVEYKRL